MKQAGRVPPYQGKAGAEPDARRARFEAAIVCHLDAAYNLARWMMGQDSDARDAVQTAALRAFSYIDSLRGDDGKAWLLGIVRNCCLSALQERGRHGAWEDIDDVVENPANAEALALEADSPQVMLERRADRDMVNTALRQLAPGFREVLILREMEELPYEAIAAIVGVPVGTVMSRLSRARRMFRTEVEAMLQKEGR